MSHQSWGYAVNRESQSPAPARGLSPLTAAQENFRYMSPRRPAAGATTATAAANSATSALTPASASSSSGPATPDLRTALAARQGSVPVPPRLPSVGGSAAGSNSPLTESAIRRVVQLEQTLAAIQLDNEALRVRIVECDRKAAGDARVIAELKHVSAHASVRSTQAEKDATDLKTKLLKAQTDRQCDIIEKEDIGTEYQQRAGELVEALQRANRLNGRAEEALLEVIKQREMANDGQNAARVQLEREVALRQKSEELIHALQQKMAALEEDQRRLLRRVNEPSPPSPPAAASVAVVEAQPPLVATVPVGGPPALLPEHVEIARLLSGFFSDNASRKLMLHSEGEAVAKLIAAGGGEAGEMEAGAWAQAVLRCVILVTGYTGQAEAQMAVLMGKVEAANERRAAEVGEADSDTGSYTSDPMPAPVGMSRGEALEELRTMRLRSEELEAQNGKLAEELRSALEWQRESPVGAAKVAAAAAAAAPATEDAAEATALLRVERDMLAAEKASLEAEAEALRASAAADVATMRSDNDALRDRVTELEAEAAAAAGGDGGGEAAAAALQEEKALVAGLEESLATVGAEAAAAATALGSQKTALEKRVAALEEALAAAEAAKVYVGAGGDGGGAGNDAAAAAEEATALLRVERDMLAAEKASLEAEAEALRESAAADAAVRSDNDRLCDRVAELEGEVGAAAAAEEVAGLRTEKAALEDRVAALEAAAAAAVAGEEGDVQLLQAELELVSEERDLLKAALDELGGCPEDGTPAAAAAAADDEPQDQQLLEQNELLRAQRDQAEAAAEAAVDALREENTTLHTQRAQAEAASEDLLRELQASQAASAAAAQEEQAPAARRLVEAEEEAALAGSQRDQAERVAEALLAGSVGAAGDADSDAWNASAEVLVMQRDQAERAAEALLAGSVGGGAAAATAAADDEERSDLRAQRDQAERAAEELAVAATAGDAELLEQRDQAERAAEALLAGSVGGGGDEDRESGGGDAARGDILVQRDQAERVAEALMEELEGERAQSAEVIKTLREQVQQDQEELQRQTPSPVEFVD